MYDLKKLLFIQTYRTSYLKLCLAPISVWYFFNSLATSSNMSLRLVSQLCFIRTYKNSNSIQKPFNVNSNHLTQTLNKPSAPHMVPVGDKPWQCSISYQHVFPGWVLGCNRNYANQNLPPGFFYWAIRKWTIFVALSNLPMKLVFRECPDHPDSLIQIYKKIILYSYFERRTWWWKFSSSDPGPCICVAICITCITQVKI